MKPDQDPIRGYFADSRWLRLAKASALGAVVLLLFSIVPTELRGLIIFVLFMTVIACGYCAYRHVQAKVTDQIFDRAAYARSENYVQETLSNNRVNSAALVMQPLHETDFIHLPLPDPATGVASIQARQGKDGAWRTSTVHSRILCTDGTSLFFFETQYDLRTSYYQTLATHIWPLSEVGISRTSAFVQASDANGNQYDRPVPVLRISRHGEVFDFDFADSPRFENAIGELQRLRRHIN